MLSITYWRVPTWVTFKYRKLFLKFWNFHCSTKTGFRQSFHIHTCIQSLKQISQIAVFLLNRNQGLIKDCLRDAGRSFVFWPGCVPSTTAVPTMQSHKYQLKKKSIFWPPQITLDTSLVISGKMKERMEKGPRQVLTGILEGCAHPRSHLCGSARKIDFSF